jgi:hypothetical protein
LKLVLGHASSGITTLQKIKKVFALFIPLMYFYSLNSSSICEFVSEKLFDFSKSVESTVVPYFQKGKYA